MIDLGRMPGLEDRPIDSVVGNDDIIRKEAKERTGRKVLNPFTDHESLSGSGLDDFWDVALKASTVEGECFSAGAV